MPSLDEIESRLQGLLEIHLLKYLPGYKPEDRIFQQLAKAMRDSIRQQGGVSLAPNVYVIIAHPSTLSRWHKVPQLFSDLSDALLTAGEEAGFHFLSKPAVTTAADPDFPADQTHIIASFSNEQIPETQKVVISQSAQPFQESIPANAFLILGGTKVVPLDQPVINIGRRLDNQVVIDDPRVSRTHAQLRIAKGRYVLFDLNSTGGTFVNGSRTVQSVLYPGDVISLAGVTLIFGQDLPIDRHKEHGDTEPKSAVSADRPTAIIPLSDTEKRKKVRRR